MARLAKNKKTIFSFVDCFEFSKFCKIDQKIFSYPKYHVYSKSEIKQVLTYLPLEVELETLIKR